MLHFMMRGMIGERFSTCFADDIDSDVHSVEFSYIPIKWMVFGTSERKRINQSLLSICIFRACYPISSHN